MKFHFTNRVNSSNESKDLLIETERVIGEGSQGTVSVGYIVGAFRLRRVAVKLKNVNVNSEQRSELSILRAIGKHSNIIRVFAGDVTNSIETLVTELLTPMTVADCVGTIPRKYRMQLLLYFITPVVDALAFVHSRHVIHRDVKPSNILLSHTGVPKLVDFGLSAIHSRKSVFSGTPGFIAPENYVGRKYTESSEGFTLALSFNSLFEGVYSWKYPHFKYHTFQFCRQVFRGYFESGEECVRLERLMNNVFMTEEQLEKEKLAFDVETGVFEVYRTITVTALGQVDPAKRLTIAEVAATESVKSLIRCWKAGTVTHFQQSKELVKRSLACRRSRFTLRL